MTPHSRKDRTRRKPAGPVAVLAACALAGLAGSAVPAAAQAAATPAAAASGIGLTASHSAVLASTTYYDRALTSRDWARTPDGLIYHSCVYDVPKGGELDTVHNKMILASGATKAIPDCPYPRLVPSAAAARTAPAAAVPAAPVSAASLVTVGASSSPDALNELRVKYAVPSAPPVTGATDYMYSDFETNSSDPAKNALLAPIVGYGPTTNGSGGANGGNFLWMAPYYIWGSNMATEPAVQVNAKDVIEGGITAHKTTCTTGCTWTVTTEDLNSKPKPLVSSLVVYTSPEFVTLLGAKLQSTAPMPPNCDMLFSSNHGVFRDIAVRTTNGKAQNVYAPHFVGSTAQPCGARPLIPDNADIDLLWQS